MSEPMNEKPQDEPTPPDGEPAGSDAPGQPQPGPDGADGAAQADRAGGTQDDSTPLARRDEPAEGESVSDDGDSETGWTGGEQDEYDGGYDYDSIGEPDYGDVSQGESGDEYQDDYEDEYEDEEEQDEDVDEVGQKKMTLIEHLDELRTRIIRALLGLVLGMIAALIISPWVIEIINKPFVEATGQKLVYDDMVSVFTMYMQISLYIGIIIASPWIFYQIWMFVAAGLYKHERKYVVYAVPFSAALFIFGALFFLLYISPKLLGAFYIFNNWFGKDNLVALVKINNNVDFMTNMMLVFGFCFQMPIAVLLLGKMGIVTVKSLKKFRKYVIVCILILAALVTSPSPLDQIALAIPMWLLYELGVVLVYFLVERKRRAEDAAMGYKPLDD